MGCSGSKGVLPLNGDSTASGAPGVRGGGATPGANGSPAGKGAGATAAPGRNFHENVAVGERHGNKKLLDLYRVDRSKTAVLGEGMTRCALLGCGSYPVGAIWFAGRCYSFWSAPRSMGRRLAGQCVCGAWEYWVARMRVGREYGISLVVLSNSVVALNATCHLGIRCTISSHPRAL
jgi:hypothetical protein